MIEAILAVVRRRSAALVARDAAELRAVHHPDFRFTTPRGDVRDLEAYIAGNTGGALVWRAQDLVAPELVVAGEVAVLTGVMHDEFERAGEPGAHDMHVTFVFVERAGEWVVLAGHAGPPA
ncbi:nuclear transport factor 2 family protein [Solirubrobacter ginsenosidimutans]|uniref:Nuclear transport factor 2 family protein n=1 Tax=Solirubrobacter ginsenosidimutans TaxID=490573 RepID=A0A9X3RY64_9ACTN|nr:nuclear transport factor 2 family protein [Solirubrobacter ginsenosidimutans]MDA0159345.1 nuclear transport factor 2 family protein [Solirubrobacter ginsenosidimutans]